MALWASWFFGRVRVLGGSTAVIRIVLPSFSMRAGIGVPMIGTRSVTIDATSSASTCQVLRRLRTVDELPFKYTPSRHDRTASAAEMAIPATPAATHTGSGRSTPDDESLAVNIQ